MSGHTPRYCLRCRYDLSHTTSGACPECGRSFDPADAGSYSHVASRVSRRSFQWGTVSSAYPLGFVVWVHMKFAVRWVYTGVRPTYGSGRTMPEWWNAIGDTIGTIYPWGLPVAFVAGFILMTVGLLIRREPPYAVWWAVMALTAPLLGWAAAFLCLVADPFDAFEWYLD